MKPNIESVVFDLDGVIFDSERVMYGIKTAQASSTAREIVTRELTENALADYFDVIIGGDAVTRSKPFPDIFLAACEAIGADPGKSICIEDSYNGIRAASGSDFAGSGGSLGVSQGLSEERSFIEMMDIGKKEGCRLSVRSPFLFYRRLSKRRCRMPTMLRAISSAGSLQHAAL